MLKQAADSVCMRDWSEFYSKNQLFIILA